MASIQTGIVLDDGFSSVMQGIIDVTTYAVSSVTQMQNAMSASVDTSGIENATSAVEELNSAMEETAMNAATPEIAIPRVAAENQQVINVDVEPNIPDPLVENPEPVETGIQINAPPTSEIEQSIAGITEQMNGLSEMQQRIQQNADSVDVVPSDITNRINRITASIQQLQANLDYAAQNPFNLDDDAVQMQLEAIQRSIAATTSKQEELNSVMLRMGIGDVDAEYQNLADTVNSTRQGIDNNTNSQNQFNQAIQQGASQADDLMNTIKGAVAAYLSIQTVGKVLNISDDLTATVARLDMMNDKQQTTQELTNMVYAAAQDARGSFSQMADVVARFGNNAKDAFGSSEEVVAFADLIQKQMTIAGASTQEAANAELQLSQALGSGVLRGDELNSIFEQAPNLIQSIADYLDVPIGKIREMAQDGELSADVVKAAIFASADDINAKFEEMPMTWGQIWQSMQNTALIAFQPVLQRLNDLANSEAVQTFVNRVSEAMAVVANIILNVFDLMSQLGGFIADNWSVIEPIVWGVIAALATYAAYLGIVKGIELASAAASAAVAVGKGLLAAATMIATGATWAETTAQMGLNSAMYACPIVWIIMLVIALIAIVAALCNWIAKTTGAANSGFGVITGGIAVVGATFVNLGKLVANIALGIGNAIAALASNMMTAFHNAIANVQSWFYNLLATALDVIAGIAAALNKLPFVEFDYSGITAAADDYAAKSAEAANSKQDYTSVSDAFNEGMNTFDTFQDGWASDAFNAGASWGDGVADAVSNFSLTDALGGTNIPNVSDYTSGFGDAIANSGVGDGVGDIADNTGSIKDSLDITEEDLKYLRDIAEQEAVNKYTVAEVSVDLSGMQNTIQSGDDIDGFMNKLTDSVNEAVDGMTEGVHE